MKNKFLLFVLVLLCLSARCAFGITVSSSPHDERQYEFHVLANGLKVILINTPKAQTSAAAMMVNVGSMADPDEFLGLAHFVEHMLFLGTEKFPTPTAFQQFIKTHGGSYNASTHSEKTQFYFNIAPGVFSQALARFSDFFMAPLFSPTWVDKELQAVDSEYKMHLNQDDAAFYEISKETSNPRHPFSRFSIGNYQTLGFDKNKLHQALKTFYETYYQANNMVLALVGPQSTSELLKLAQLYFSGLQNKPVPKIKSEVLFDKNVLGIDIHVKSKSEKRELYIKFPFPSFRVYFKEKPGFVIRALLGNEGPGSLSFALKKRQWINAMQVSYSTLSNEQDEITFYCSLTEKGMKNINLITQTLFGYINLIKKQGVPKTYFDELKRMSNLEFQYPKQEAPLTLALHFTDALQYAPPEALITHRYWDASLQLPQNQIQAILSYLTPENMRRYIVSQNERTDKESKWYQGQYSVNKLSQHEIKALSQKNSGSHLSLPPKNPYIPEKLNLKDNVTQKKLQKLILPGVTLWHQQESAFKKPEADIYINIISSCNLHVPANYLLSSLYTKAAQEVFMQNNFQSAFAGANFEIANHLRGITVSLSGYTDKQDALLKKLLIKMRNLKITSTQFDLIKDRMRRALVNYHQKPLQERAFQDLMMLLVDPAWHPDELLQTLKTLSLKDLEKFSKDYWEKSHIEMLVNGNYSAEEAEVIAKIAKDNVSNQKFAEFQPPYLKIAKLPKNSKKIQSVSSEDGNQIAVWYCQNATADDATVAKTLLLAKILEAPFYHALRTEQQLGYALSTNSIIVNKVSGLMLWVQSPSQTSAALLLRMQDFVQRYQASLNKITQKELDSYRAGILRDLREPPKSLQEQSALLWVAIEKGDYAFSRKEEIATALEKISVSDMITFSNQILSPVSSVGQILVFSHAPGKNVEHDPIFSLNSYRASATYFPEKVS